jgi:hypothetical protein
MSAPAETTPDAPIVDETVAAPAISPEVSDRLTKAPKVAS